MMKLSDAAIKDMVVVTLAEDMRLLDEWGQKKIKERDIEIARGLKNKSYPLIDISEITGIPLHEIEVL